MSTAGELIRSAARSDLDAVVALEQLCYRFPWSRNQFLQELDNPVAALDLFVHADEIAGYISTWLIGTEMQILNLATSPRYQRLGIGKKLLDHVIGRGLGSGLTSVWLEVREQNQAALSLYRRCGFQLQGRRRHYYPDGEDALLLSRDFDPASNGDTL